MSLLGHKKKEKYSLPLMKKLPLIKKTFISSKKYNVFSEDPNKVQRPK